jgi:hypothetical protein
MVWLRIGLLEEARVVIGRVALVKFVIHLKLPPKVRTISCLWTELQRPYAARGMVNAGMRYHSIF